MKRFHVHMHVSDLPRNIAFYSALFHQPPTRTEDDYAKWMLDDPPVNFAISARGANVGLDHLGFQVETADELNTLKTQAQAADMTLFDEGETTCCYARSDKYWLTDPQGVAWEQFHTLDNIPVFSKAHSAAASATACCSPPTPAAAQPRAVALVAASCCGPASPSPKTGCC